MRARKEPRPYLNPYVAGTILGVVLFATFYVTGGGLGASPVFDNGWVKILRVR
jgi:hypothetical protein